MVEKLVFALALHRPGMKIARLLTEFLLFFLSQSSNYTISVNYFCKISYLKRFIELIDCGGF